MGDRAYFVSDIHLENLQERNGQNLLRFLHSIAAEEKVADLYLLGDIFDFWLSNHKVFVKKFEALWVPLKTMKKRGSRLVYFEGNHDLHLKPFFEKELGFEVYTDHHYEVIAGQTVRLEHGDLINLEDEAYLKWRAFARHPLVEPLAHYLPGRFWDRVGEKLSAKSRGRSRQYRHENENAIRDMIQKHALRAYQDKSFDLIISGHMHVKVDESLQVNGKTIRNLNLGSWLEPEAEALRLDATGLTWVKV